MEVDGRGRMSHGVGDQLGGAAVECQVPEDDFHATILLLVGVQHTGFTDVAGNSVNSHLGRRSSW